MDARVNVYSYTKNLRSFDDELSRTYENRTRGQMKLQILVQ